MTATVAFADVDLSELSVVSRGKSKAGNAQFDLSQPLRVNLTPDDWGRILYRARGPYTDEAMKIAGGSGIEKNEELKLVLKLSPEAVAFVEAVEQKAREGLAPHVRKCEWNSSIAEDGSLRVKLVLTGRELTAIGVKTLDGKTLSGSGCDFLKPILDDPANNELRHASAKAVVHVDRLWSAGNKVGLSLKLVALACRIAEPEAVQTVDVNEMFNAWDA